MKCLVCASAVESLRADALEGNYWQCATCHFIFREPAERLSYADECERYGEHQNSPKDAAYLKFLDPAWQTVLKYTHPGDVGMDYGCGPGPALSFLGKRDAREIIDYDPIFYPDQDALNRKYDFLVSTEVVEHFHHPLNEFERMHRYIKSGHPMIIMTWIFDTVEAFIASRYHRDPTHVSFYSVKSLEVVAEKLRLRFAREDERVGRFY